MPTITFIGAGSRGFGTSLLGDFLSDPELADSEFRLMDVDEERLGQIEEFAHDLIEVADADATVVSTTDRETALDDADYVFTMFYNGWEAFEREIRIPEEYGVEQAIGNMVNPSGVFAAQRNIPVILDVARDMERLCPDAPLLNYTNPVPSLTGAVRAETDVDCYGLCHSVQGTAYWLADRYLDVPPDELDYWVAGANHVAWFLRLEHGGRDLYPHLTEAMTDPEIYEQDTVRFEMLRHFDYFVTESSAHMSEYVPYFRTDSERIEELAGTGAASRVPTAYYLEQRQEYGPEMKTPLEFDDEDLEVERSAEYGSRIVHAMETGEPQRMNINVPNEGLITNLRDGSIVEVPCLVDGLGIHPCRVGDLPTQLASITQSYLDVYDLAIEGAVERDRETVHQAVKRDPLTAAALTLDEIHEMTEELFEASAAYLPTYD